MSQNYSVWMEIQRPGAGRGLGPLRPVCARATEGRQLHGVGPRSDRPPRSDPRPPPLGKETSP